MLDSALFYCNYKQQKAGEQISTFCLQIRDGRGKHAIDSQWREEKTDARKTQCSQQDLAASSCLFSGYKWLKLLVSLSADKWVIHRTFMLVGFLQTSEHNQQQHDCFYAYKYNRHVKQNNMQQNNIWVTLTLLWEIGLQH